MNLNKLARWASVAAFSTLIPAAAMAHSRLHHPTTAPSSLTSRHVKASSGKKALVSKLHTRGIKAKQLKTSKHKSIALKSRKISTSKLVSRKHLATKLTTKKHLASKLTSRKHLASKLTTARTKAHLLASHKLSKSAVKPATPIAPTM